RISTGTALFASPTASSRRSAYDTQCLATASTPPSEGGARCVSSARRDLCGGRGAILVPTATIGWIDSAAPSCRTEVTRQRRCCPKNCTCAKVDTRGCWSRLRIVYWRGVEQRRQASGCSGAFRGVVHTEVQGQRDGAITACYCDLSDRMAPSRNHRCGCSQVESRCPANKVARLPGTAAIPTVLRACRPSHTPLP